MKILIFAHGFYPAIGGIETTAEVLATGFVERYQAEVVVVTRTPEIPGEEKSFPFRVVREPSPKDLMREVRWADVIFHNNPVMRFYWPQIIYRRPWAVVFRSYLWDPTQTYTPLQNLKLKAKYALIRTATTMISNSKSTASTIPDPTRIIYNCYRDDMFRVTNTQERPRNSLIYVGRLSKEKGSLVLFEAIKQLKERGHDVQLTVVGADDKGENSRYEAERLGISDSVNFTGKLFGEDIVAELNKNSIAIVPSLLPETFGTVALEAAACGCVTVTSNAGGLPEAAGNTGLKFRPGDSTDLADKIEELLTKPELYDYHKGLLAEHVQKFSKKKFIENYYTMLEGLRK